MRRKRWTVLLLVPVLLSGCGVLGLGSAARPGDSSAAPSPGASWIVVAQGSATPSPSVSRAAAAAPTPSNGFPPVAVAPANPTRTAVPTCQPNMFDFSKIATADVTPGATSALVSWYNVGGYNLVEFRLTATSQDMKGGAQRDVGWLTVEPTMPCGQMSATITGLDRRTAYVFSVDAVVLRRSGDGTHAATVARSGAVRTG